VQEDGVMPKKIDPAVKERAVKLVLEHQAEYPSLYAAVSAVAKQQRTWFLLSSPPSCRTAADHSQQSTVDCLGQNSFVS
jgi:hypothetical protein